MSASLPLAPRALPDAAARARWEAADRAARPDRLARFRALLAAEGLDAWFGVRRETARYLSGFVLGEGEEKVAGVSGQLLVSADEVVLLADSRYRVQALEEAPDARLAEVYGDLPQRWPELVGGLRPIGGGAPGSVRRIGMEAGAIPHATWLRLAAALPDVDLVPADGILEQLRAVKEPAELERIGAACAVADGALERLLPRIRPGVTEHELALELEWQMRTHGAEALAFDVACLAGPRAALPHGSPGARAVAAGAVLLFDFGAQVAGYRSDMTRTLFVGAPTPADLALHALVREAQDAAFTALAAAVDAGVAPTNRAIDAAARAVIVAAGHGPHFGHGLGHGIGLATHEAPSLGLRAAEALLPSPSVFSVEPGVYLDGVTGVRIEDLVQLDIAAGTLAFLTAFPRDVVVVG
ncbi:MAG: M24 family metallopeptidase [Chloroflexota bacterium]